jgi:acyl carrier protein
MSTSIDSLIPIFQEIFENNNLQISEKTSASDIEEWDSLNHIYLVVAIEKNLSIKFTTQEIQSWQCVGDILHSINTKK